MRDVIPRDLRPKTGKPRILCFTDKYPQFSETYMHEEFLALSKDYEVQIVALGPSHYPRKNTLPFIRLNYRDPNLCFGAYEQINTEFTNPQQLKFLTKLDRIIHQFKPDILHGHYLYIAWLLHHVSQRHGLPFTIRTHSFDMLQARKDRLYAGIDALKSPNCTTIFTFPEFVDLLLSRGVEQSKVTAAWPIANVERFYNETPRQPTGKVMCAGPCTRKKLHTAFIDLANKMEGSGIEFSLYTKGLEADRVIKYNEDHGSPVSIRFEEPESMAKVYRQHDWIVYPSDTVERKVGLPVAIVEAQASGIGVCLQELPGRRAAQMDFLGGGGYVFKSIDDVPEIISRPYPEEMRLNGLENSKKCDIRSHKKMLDEAWSPLLAQETHSISLTV